MDGLSLDPGTDSNSGARQKLVLLDLPPPLLQNILVLLGSKARGAYVSCRQLHDLLVNNLSSTTAGAQYLLRRYRGRAVVPALYGPCAQIISLLSRAHADGQLQDLPEDARQAQQLQRQGEAALELLHSLYSAGVQREPNVLLMAARAGHTEVVREVLGFGQEGLDLAQALRLALENAGHVDRARELVQVLEEAGAILDPEERLQALTHNPNRRVAGQLLEAFGLRAAVHQDKVLQFALQTRNVTLAHELLDAGARPPPGCVATASFTGDVALFARVLRAGVDPTELNSLCVVARHDRSGMLVQQMIDTFTEPPFGKDTLLQAFLAACESNNINSVDVLLRTGVNPAAVNALEGSASRGHAGMVRLLLGSYPSHLEGSALHSAFTKAMVAACGGGHVETVQELLAAGAESGPGLVEAAQKNQMHVVRALLESGGSRVHGEHNTQSALCAACRLAQMECLEELLCAGADPAGHSHALLAAANAGFTSGVRRLLDTGSFSTGNPQLSDALTSAARDGHMEVVQLLVDAGAEPVRGIFGAVRNGHADIAKALLVTGRCPPTHEDMERALVAALRRDDGLALAQLLLDAGVDPLSGLEEAARAGNMPLFRFLMMARRDPDDYPQGRREQLARALDFVAYHFSLPLRLDFIRELVAGGAEHLDALGCHEVLCSADMVRTLLAAGPCPPDHGRMREALRRASRIGSLEVVRELLRAGVEPGEGLVDAAEMERPEVLRALLDTGRCPPGHARVAAALETARRSGSSQAAELLATWQGNVEPQAPVLEHM